jgi:hypothetical protein
MPLKIQNEDGTETEVYTQEELEAKAREEAERIAAEKQAEIDRIAEEKAALEERNRKLEDKEYNFERLRKQKEGTIGAEVLEKLSAMEEAIRMVQERPKHEIKEEFIKQHIGEDKEKRELFDYYFNRLIEDNPTKEQILKASNEAMALISGGSFTPSPSGGLFSTGASLNYRETAPSGGVSEISKQIGSHFGITDEDRKKYGKK